MPVSPSKCLGEHDDPADDEGKDDHDPDDDEDARDNGCFYGTARTCDRLCYCLFQLLKHGGVCWGMELAEQECQGNNDAR